MNTSQSISRPVIYLAFITGIVLLIPLVAMQFTNEVVWTLSDFVIAGSLLFGTGLTFILATKTSENKMYRFAMGLALGSSLFLIWANLAVGIIGPEDHAFNLLYFGVIGIGILGSLFTRFKAYGMMFVLIAMSFAHVILLVAALLTNMQSVPSSSVLEIFGVNGMFIFLFTTAALLFRYAEKKEQST
ncbi:hypothetical protein [Gracilimonas mengyeensis]|uniref:Uncharacterized protein n=1 Tax=Gracilimonas mengyeensis TaxID=1302730 RepID=A0A521C0Y7_9BACT|nr:hypothetical protein [Gracilimonas mengyeensis]SMO53119.1 hypothetical protein SAMN06265219_10464 [Gracilimonas mengyeensis]